MEGRSGRAGGPVVRGRPHSRPPPSCSAQPIGAMEPPKASQVAMRVVAERCSRQIQREQCAARVECVDVSRFLRRTRGIGARMFGVGRHGSGRILGHACFGSLSNARAGESRRAASFMLGSRRARGRASAEHPCHSARNVIAGSTDAARRAGAQHARAATPPSSAMTPAYVVRSTGEIP
jgi:hypothetical protein